MQVVQMIIGRQ